MTTKEQSLERLIERVKAATAADREIDARVHLAIFPEFGGPPYWQPHIGHWVRMDGSPDIVDAPSYTACIDAALALADRVLPRWDKSHGELIWTFGMDGERKWICDLRYFRAKATANTAPLAILSALLQALKETSHDHE